MYVTDDSRETVRGLVWFTIRTLVSHLSAREGEGWRKREAIREKHLAFKLVTSVSLSATCTGCGIENNSEHDFVINYYIHASWIGSCLTYPNSVRILFVVWSSNPSGNTTVQNLVNYCQFTAKQCSVALQRQ